MVSDEEHNETIRAQDQIDVDPCVSPFYLFTFQVTTTTAQSIVTIAGVNDSIFGICNTITSGSTGAFNANYPTNTESTKAIDGLTITKYLSFGNPTTGCISSDPRGMNTRFYVIPEISNESIAIGILFVAANDYLNRDQIKIMLEEMNTTNSTALHSAASWSLIYNDSTAIDSSIDPARQTYVNQQNFSNTIPFHSYRLFVTFKHDTDGSL
ncbi:unnamed protein product [Rotaria magnacalcarata]|uniref:Uncharacterized protein n=1 Tax=Rotaria magnacalcarata TaxID=392030 RepID=A0A816U4G7_9BILA|nr:unnamed protein product [Rotaria magnacalcarata]